MSLRNILAAVLGLMLVIWVVMLLVSGDDLPDVETLIEQVKAGDEATRLEAASQLASHPEVTSAQLTELADKETTPSIRAALIGGLVRQRQWENMPRLLTALEDSSELVRESASAGVMEMLDMYGTPFPNFRPQAERDAVSAEYRKRYDEWNASGQRSPAMSPPPAAP